MAKYTVNLSVTIEADNEQEARRYISNQLLKGRWNEAKIVDIQRQISAGSRGLRAKMYVVDDLILPEFDENTPNIKRIYQTWEDAVDNCVKEEE